MTRVEKARRAVATLVVLALVAAFSYGVSAVLVRRDTPKFQLTSTRAFSITSALDGAYSTCDGTPTDLLYPGATRCLVVTIHNPYGAPLTLVTLTMSVTGFTPASTDPSLPACAPTMVTPASFASHLPATVPARSGAVPGTASIDVPITLTTTGNQDNCADGTFHFSYLGTAVLAYAASCETVSVTPGTVTTETGTLRHLDVSGGTVFLAPTAVVKGNVTVAATGVLVSTGATITGNVTSAGGQVALEAETSVGKNVTADGGALAIGTTTTVSGTVTATGTRALCIDGASTSTTVTIGGSVTVAGMPGGSHASVCAADLGANLTYRANGATARIGNATSLALPTGSRCAGGSSVTGTLVVTANSGTVTVSANTGTGNLPATNNTAPLVITTNAIPGSVRPNTGNLTVISNSGGITVDRNTVARNVTVSSNAGGTLLTNSVGGNCNLKANTPLVHGADNTVSGTVNTCNGTH